MEAFDSAYVCSLVVELSDVLGGCEPLTANSLRPEQQGLTQTAHMLQVFILLKHSTASMKSYNVPEQLLSHSETVWLQAKADETQVAATPFEKDVLRVLSLLNINTVERKVRHPSVPCCTLDSHIGVCLAGRFKDLLPVLMLFELRPAAFGAWAMQLIQPPCKCTSWLLPSCFLAAKHSKQHMQVVIEDGLFAVDLWIPAASLAIMCLPKDKFTVNSVAVKGPHGIMQTPQALGQTKMMQNLFRICQVPVCMIPHHIWMDLGSDEIKRDFLQRQIRKSSSMSFGGEANLV
jgi:hypothetical protein